MNKHIPLCGLLVAGIVIGLANAQERSLIRFSESRDTIKSPEERDREAIAAWWRDTHGDGGPTMRILEMKARAKPADFSVKINDDWKNCEKFLGPLAKNATATVAKIEGSGGGKKSVTQWLFIIRDGEVVFSHFTWKKI